VKVDFELFGCALACGFAQKVAAAHYSTASEATGCYTQRTEVEKHRVKLPVASGRFARGTVIVARYWEKPDFLCKALACTRLVHEGECGLMVPGMKGPLENSCSFQET
jgi:hypothetical protein